MTPSASELDRQKFYADFSRSVHVGAPILRFDLYTRPETTFSGPLQNAFDSGLINRLDIPR